jgi:hypothetical protein
MFFFLTFLFGVIAPFLFWKSRGIWIKWLPGIIFLSAALVLGLKILIKPAQEMALLGEIVYFMLFGLAAIGSFIGALILRIMQKQKRS